MTVVSHTTLQQSVREFHGKLRTQQQVRNTTRHKDRIKAKSKTCYSKHKQLCVIRGRAKVSSESTAKTKYSKDFNYFVLDSTVLGRGKIDGDLSIVEE